MTYRRVNELADFLYESETVQLKDENFIYSDIASKKRFEAIDLVILEGDPCAESWDLKFFQAQTLVRTVMGHEGKRMIGIGLGANLMGLYTTTNGLRFDRTYRVIRNAAQ